MQLTAKHKVSTPVNWRPGDDVKVAASAHGITELQFDFFIRANDEYSSDRGIIGGGAPFGGCFGFPSGPSSSLACATTIGALCACDTELANCIAVRAVVASSTRRSFVMVMGIPEGSVGRRSTTKR